MDGTWESSDTWDGIGAGMVAIGEISDAVPADVKAEALAIRSGPLRPLKIPFRFGKWRMSH